MDNNDKFSYLNEYDSSKLIGEAGINMAKSFVCHSVEETCKKAEILGYPVVMKILSSDIIHKTDAGCVKIGLLSKEEVHGAYGQMIRNARTYKPDAKLDGILVCEMVSKGLETIIGVKKDPQFGSFIMFGFGGIYVEVFEDISFRLIPFEKEDVIKMIEETLVSKVIKGSRGLEYDMDSLVEAIVNVGSLVENNPNIEEIEINPFYLYEKGLGGKGIDALVKVKRRDVPE